MKHFGALSLTVFLNSACSGTDGIQPASPQNNTIFIEEHEAVAAMQGDHIGKISSVPLDEDCPIDSHKEYGKIFETSSVMIEACVDGPGTLEDLRKKCNRATHNVLTKRDSGGKLFWICEEMPATRLELQPHL